MCVEFMTTLWHYSLILWHSSQKFSLIDRANTHLTSAFNTKPINNTNKQTKIFCNYFIKYLIKIYFSSKLKCTCVLLNIIHKWREKPPNMNDALLFNRKNQRQEQAWHPVDTSRHATTHTANHKQKKNRKLLFCWAYNHDLIFQAIHSTLIQKKIINWKHVY